MEKLRPYRVTVGYAELRLDARDETDAIAQALNWIQREQFQLTMPIEGESRVTQFRYDFAEWFDTDIVAERI